MTVVYSSPLEDILFSLSTSGDLPNLQALSAYEDCSDDLVEAVLTEAGKVASEVLAPVNLSGDMQAARLENHQVITPDGWQHAYDAFQSGGWMGLGFDIEDGGQGMPDVLSTAVNEIWHSANMAFSLCPLLTQGAIEAFVSHASDDLKSKFMTKLVDGVWSGTMNLTEPQAGSDLALVRSTATPQDDHYLIKGQKIFITYGEHDLTENIVHLVLARLPDAPDGVKGISLFAVPKYTLNDAGEPDSMNDLKCIKIEHKLGIHGSPTCIMSYGEQKGAVGYLIGEENAGLACMFTMMNKARHGVGLQGLSISERSFQQALAYANERVQSNPAGSDEAHAKIIHHPDVKRMLLMMKSNIQAMRALCHWHASSMDYASKAEEENSRKNNFKLLEFLTPIVKGWCTELSNELTSYGIQVHGGMGYIEETGSAQFYRDARITAIYEGTTAIQANDLIGRKLIRDDGAVIRTIIEQARVLVDDLDKLTDQRSFEIMKTRLHHALNGVSNATQFLLENGKQHPALCAAGSVNLLNLYGLTLSGYKLIEQAYRANDMLNDENSTFNPEFLKEKISTAEFYASQMLPRASGFEDMIIRGSQSVLDCKI